MTINSAKKQRTREWVHWAGKIDLTQKPKALCKPCWELKYCPYGALVEEFPLPHDRSNPKGCRIFGHECPVFHVAESISETRELRRASREIPQAVKTRVLFRDNRICAGCNTPIPVDQVHYDHIIPWTKGGPSEEHNIQLLCRKCNLSKGKDFEENFLVTNFHGHLRKPVGTEFVRFLLNAAYFAVHFRQQQGHLPNAEQFAKAVGLKKATDDERQVVEIFFDLDDFFRNRPRKNFTQAVFDALKHRWGWSDGRIYRLKNSADKHGVDPTVLVRAEMNLVERLGWQLKSGESVIPKWLRT
jgi:Pyruvate/2-oxoacid:ferredoxin oxidoreductase delta subunit